MVGNGPETGALPCQETRRIGTKKGVKQKNARDYHQWWAQSAARCFQKHDDPDAGYTDIDRIRVTGPVRQTRTDKHFAHHGIEYKKIQRTADAHDSKNPVDDGNDVA